MRAHTSRAVRGLAFLQRRADHTHGLLGVVRRRTASSLSLSHLMQQCRVQFKAGDAAQTHVEIVPVLSAADFALSVSDPSVDVTRLLSIEQETETQGVKTLRIHKTSSEDAHVRLLLPHTVDLNIALANGSVRMHDKVEGDVKVVVGRGNIALNKVRGKNISLKTNGGCVNISNLVEGETVRLEASESVSCKRLMAAKAEVKLGKGPETGKSEFGAIYAANCSVVSTNRSGQAQLRVGNVHGHLRVNGEGFERVNVESVTGVLDVEDSGDKCDVSAHFDSWSNDISSSILVGGNVRVSLQPADPIGVELHGTKVTIGAGCTFDSSEMDQLDEDYAVFTGELRAQEAVETTSGASGKINVDSAKDDAMKTSFFMRETGSSGGDDKAKPRLFVHALSGEVTLDQLDWMANMKRKHLKQ